MTEIRGGNILLKRTIICYDEFMVIGMAVLKSSVKNIYIVYVCT